MKAPRWAAEAVAWCASLVLVAGVAVVVSGVIEPKTTVTNLVSETPVVVAPKVVPVHAVPGTDAVPGVVSRARTAVPTEVSLGAPPGPQHDAVPTSVAAPADRYAFLVGVTRYRKPTHDTIAGANDAVFIRSLLLASGWLPQNIKIVTNEAAVGSSVRAGMAWLVSKSRPGTFTLFHYSGHVKQAGGHEFLWPYDHDLIPDTDVASSFNRGTGKMWVDIAGCEAGGFIEDLPSSRVLVSTSSEQHQKSYEFPQWGESVFAGLVWDLGLGQGQADADNNGITTVGEALRYAGYYAQAITLRQRPYGRQTPQTAGDPVRGWTLDNPPA